MPGIVELFVLPAVGVVRGFSDCLAGLFFPAVVFENDGLTAKASRTDVKSAILRARDIKVIFGSTSFVILFVHWEANAGQALRTRMGQEQPGWEKWCCLLSIDRTMAAFVSTPSA